MKTGEEVNQRSHTAERRVAERLNVEFFQKSRWDVAVKAAPAPDFRRAKRRVMTLSMDDKISQEESSFDAILARAIAWAVVRARAAASSLGTT